MNSQSSFSSNNNDNINEAQPMFRYVIIMLCPNEVFVFRDREELHANTGNNHFPFFFFVIHRSMNIANRNRVADLHLQHTAPMMFRQQTDSLHKSHQHSSKKQQPSKARWVVSSGKPMPILGLVRRSVEIFCDVSTIASRIDDSLRKRSVEVEFDNDNAEAICKTRNFVEYRIGLYASDDGKSAHVEIIRIRGCGFAYRTEYNAIIHAAKGAGVLKSVPIKMTITPELLKLYTPPSRNELEDTIYRACDQFHSRNRHNVLFALQNLASITNPGKVNTGAAHAMLELIMSNVSNVLDLILAIYGARTEFVRDIVSDQICQSILTILFQGIQYVSSKNDGFLDKTYKEFAANLIPHLIQDVKECESNRSNNACLALQCLQLILTNSSLAWQSVEEFNVRDIVMQAEHYGSREYFNLEQIAKSTIEVLSVH